MRFIQCLVALMGLFALTSLSLAAEEYSVGQQFSDKLRSGGDGPTMTVIPGGRFMLGGAPISRGGPGLIRIDHQIAIGVFEITLGQYRHFLKTTRSGNLDKLPEGGDELPVSNVSWDDAEAYVSWLSRETGHYYHLPSASEWEYAARAGTSSSYFWGDAIGENRANCLDCGSKFDGRLAPVGSFPANSWGLHDMHGNVWEWTKDCIDANSAPPPDGSPQLFGNCESRELRGGSAESDSWSIRAGARAFGLRKMSDTDVGFRVIMDLP